MNRLSVSQNEKSCPGCSSIYLSYFRYTRASSKGSRHFVKHFGRWQCFTTLLLILFKLYTNQSTNFTSLPLIKFWILKTQQVMTWAVTLLKKFVKMFAAIIEKSHQRLHEVKAVDEKEHAFQTWKNGQRSCANDIGGKKKVSYHY